MKQLMNCRYETTAFRINKLLTAARDEDIIDIDAELDMQNTAPLLNTIRHDAKTAQSLAHISNTMQKYVEGAHHISEDTSLKTHIRRLFGTPSLRKLLNEETMHIVKAVRPPLILQTA